MLPVVIFMCAEKRYWLVSYSSARTSDRRFALPLAGGSSAGYLDDAPLENPSTKGLEAISISISISLARDVDIFGSFL
jgi:hypothetical protein